MVDTEITMESKIKKSVADPVNLKPQKSKVCVDKCS